jgi:membrane associated rhomboid family serine protease
VQPHYFRIGNIFTAMFIHANWINIAGNVLFLWVFGNTVEDILGHVKFLLFYLFCGVTAALAQTVVHPSSTTPMVGAGGAIAGVMGAYLLKFPRSRVDMVLFALLIFRFELPAWSMLAYWFATQLYGGLGGIREASQSGTAFFAHVGGFVQGIVMVHWMGARERVSRRRDLYW